MATYEELRKALDLAVEAGDGRSARDLAMRVAKMERDQPDAVKAWTEASKTRTAVEGSLADRDRMQPPPEPIQQAPFGTRQDFMRGIPNAAYNFATLPLTLAASVPDSPVSPLGPRQELARNVQEFGERNFPAPNDSLMGRAGQFTGAGLVGGIPNIMRSTASGGLLGGAKSVARNVGGSLSAAAGSEVGGNLFEGAGGSRVLGETIGALTPAFLTRQSANLLTGATQKKRAANSLVAKEAMDDALQLGLDDVVSAAMASPNARVKQFERLLASVPGGMRVMHEFARKLNARLTSALQGLTGQRSSRDAGVHLSRGINRRIDRLNADASRRYNIAERAIDPSTPVQTANFQTTITNLRGSKPDTVEDIIDAVRAGKGDILPQLDDALNKLSSQRSLTFAEADAIRKAIGQEIQGSTIIAANPQIGELKKLYAALSDDITNSLTGQQRVLYQNARKNWSRVREEVDQVLEPTIGKSNLKFEDVYKRAFQGKAESATVLRSVYKDLNPREREVVTKTFIAKMGKVGDEALEEAGDIPLNPNFRMQTFISNWRSLPSESKKIIFQGQEKFRKDMDAFVRFVDRTLETNAAFANPSQSGPVGLAAATAYLALAGAASGYLGYMAGTEDSEKLTATGGGIAGLLVAAKSIQWQARLMTSPRFVNWLARGTRVPVSKTPEHFAQLSVIAQQDEAIAEDIASFMDFMAQSTDERQLYGPRQELAGEQ